MRGASIKLSSPATREFWEVPVLFEDADLLALDKPSGLLTSPDRCNPARPNLIELLHAGIEAGKPWAVERSLGYLMNSHRLDFGTSGILLLAKSKPVLVQLANLFGSEKPLREYIALVRGRPLENSFVVDVKIAPHPARPEIVHVDGRRGKKSRTRFEVLERFKGWALIACQPVTGQPQQIRVHLRHRGLPIVGDTLYGGVPLMLSQLKRDYEFKAKEAERPLIGRVALHATRLTLPHPVTGGTLVIESPWPRDLAVTVKYLRRYAPERPAQNGTLP